MSRIGKKPIPVPAGVDVTVTDGVVKVKGKNGELTFTPHAAMDVTFDKDARKIVVARPDDERQNRALHGLTRSLVANMVEGVTTYFEKKLEIQGVGYNAVLAGKQLKLQVGYANTIILSVPVDVICEVPDPTHINVKSANKHSVGQFAADIRGVRPPEPYKGKGIRYVGEHVRRKAGKALAGSS